MTGVGTDGRSSPHCSKCENKKHYFRVMNILVIRFRQMGDSILSTVLTNTLHQSLEGARIDVVLNDNLAPLFAGHPSISNIYTFSNKERHNAWTYIRKVWQITHQTRYDIIIDMRSTVNTTLFSWFSLHTPFRIGLKKVYTRFVFNHRFDVCGYKESIIDHNLKLLHPLESMSDINYTKDFTLHITEEEKESFRQYMVMQGIDFRRPVALLAVTTRVKIKSWAQENMRWLTQQFIERYPNFQIIYNYAPYEEAEVIEEYRNEGCPANVFVNIQAKSPRELVAMCANIDLFLGNEGGARHIAHSMGKPSFVICAPTVSKYTWIPQNNVPAEAMSPSDFLKDEDIRELSYEDQMKLVKKEVVWKHLQRFMEKFIDYEKNINSNA